MKSAQSNINIGQKVPFTALVLRPTVATLALRGVSNPRMSGHWGKNRYYH
jgi:hypothetical protein